MEPKKEQIKGQISGKALTSRQDKTGVFKRIKAYSKPIAKAVGTLVAASAIAWTLNTGKANAQDYTVVSDSKNKTESIIEGPTIFGTKTFDVKYNKGILYFDSVKVEDKGFAIFQVDVENAKGMRIDNLTNQDVTSIYYTKLEGKEEVAYLVFEHGILGVIPKATPTKGGGNYSFVGSENDKIFMDATFIAPNGSILATTPTTLLIISKDFTFSNTYKGMCGDDVLDLTKPSFSQGKESGIVDLRDPTFTDGKMAVKLEINVSKFSAKVVEDKYPIGGGN